MVNNDKEIVLVNNVKDFVNFAFQSSFSEVQVQEWTSSDFGARFVRLGMLLNTVLKTSLNFELWFKGFWLFGLVAEFVCVIVLLNDNFFVFFVDFN
jgi:hypothetical protein